MLGMRMRLAVVAGLVVALGLGVMPAEAHRRLAPATVAVETTAALDVALAAPPAEALGRLVWTAGPSPVDAPVLVVVALAVAGVLASRRPRRAAALVMVLALAVFSVEAGVHSVHHLGDRERSEHCAVAVAAQHLSGDLTDGVPLDGPALVASTADVVVVAESPSSRAVSPHQGRAPPVLA